MCGPARLNSSQQCESTHEEAASYPLFYSPARQESQRLKCQNYHILGTPHIHGVRENRNKAVEQVQKSCFPCIGKAFLEAIHAYAAAFKLVLCTYSACEETKKRLDMVAPRCGWHEFRNWVITILACNENHGPFYGNITWLGTGGILDLDEIMVSVTTKQYAQDLETSNPCVDLQGAFDLLTWATRISDAIEWALEEHGWYRLLPCLRMSSLEGLRNVSLLGICPNRLWNVLGISTRGSLDAPILIGAARGMLSSSLHAERERSLGQKDRHKSCTEQHCNFTDDDTSTTHQLHKCENKDACSRIFVDPSQINAVFSSMGKPDRSKPETTAWDITSLPLALMQSGHYVAISHVWADGTGAGVQEPGHVNSCLFKYFAKIAEALGCDGVWWDVICVPTTRQERRRALNVMLDNYRNAEYTVVHDAELLRFEWNDNNVESAALAVVMSTWFTRGWTAAELFASKRVKILFKKQGEQNDGMPLIKDLDDDVLSKQPVSARNDRREGRRYTTLGHHLASDIIRRCRTGRAYEVSSLWDRNPRSLGRSEVTTLRDLMAILRPRSTAWPKDRITVAGLMAFGRESFDASFSIIDMTKEILKKLSLVRIIDLYHMEIPVCSSGPWSWCPPSIFDLGRSPPAVFVHAKITSQHGRLREAVVLQDGCLVSYFKAIPLADGDSRHIMPYSSHQAQIQRMQSVLSRWKHCILLSDGEIDSPLHILAIPLRVSRATDEEDFMVYFQYVCCVSFYPPGGQRLRDDSALFNCHFGDETDGIRPLSAEHVMNEHAYWRDWLQKKSENPPQWAFDDYTDDDPMYWDNDDPQKQLVHKSNCDPEDWPDNDDWPESQW